MKKICLLIFACTLTCVILFLSACTKNPLSDDDINLVQRTTVKGKILLSDNSTPDNVFVWLEGLEISTYSKTNGDFTLTLPAPQTQPGGGVTGEYSIYYYLGNYQYKTSSVSIIDGYFQFGEKDIAENGSIKQTIQLQKLLHIETSMVPDHMNVGDTLDATITLSLQALSGPVKVETLKENTDFVLAVFFKPQGKPIEEVLQLPCNLQPKEETILLTKNWYINLYTHWLHIPEEQAVYEIVPYLRLVQDGLPNALIKSISSNADKYDYEYLHIPYKWNLGQFSVK